MLGNIIPFVFQSERFLRESVAADLAVGGIRNGCGTSFSLDAHRLVVVARK